METTSIVLVLLLIVFIALYYQSDKANKENEKEQEKKREKLELDNRNLKNEIKELKESNHKNKINSLSLLMKDQDYRKIKEGTKFILLSEFERDKPIHVNRVLIQLPDNKYQIVSINLYGVVTEGTQMGVVDTLDEVVNYIKKYPYAVVEY